MCVWGGNLERKQWQSLELFSLVWFFKFVFVYIRFFIKCCKLCIVTFGEMGGHTNLIITQLTFKKKHLCDHWDMQLRYFV